MIHWWLKLIIIYKKHRQKEKISQNGPAQSFNLTWLLGNPTTDSRFRITLVREGRPGLKLCKSPGAESTVEKKTKKTNRNVQLCNEAIFYIHSRPQGKAA